MDENSAEALDYRSRVPTTEFLRFAAIATDALPRDKANALWRSIINRFPDNASLANQYVFELLLAERWDEIESFRAKATEYRSDALDLRYIDIALARGDVNLAQDLVQRFLSRHGETPSLLVSFYNLNILQKQFGAAAEVASRLKGMLPAEMERAAFLHDRAVALGRLDADWAPYRTQKRDFDTYVINMDADVERLARTQQQLGGVDFSRIPGVKGAHLPNTVLSTLTRNHGQMQKGTVGCFLSHVCAWERVVSAGRPALVLEDDAWLLVGLPHSLSALDLPQSYDLVFMNERMLPKTSRYPDRPIGVRTVAASVRTKDEHWSSAGTDGYLVSPRGAQRLLAMVERDGIAGDVDWRLISYGLSAEQRRSVVARGGFAGAAVSFHEAFHSASSSLKAYVLVPPIIRQFVGGSVRLWDNALAHSHMATLKTVRLRNQRSP